MPRKPNWQLRTEEEESSYLSRIEGWKTHLDDPQKCLEILATIMRGRSLKKSKRKAKAMKANA